MEQKKKGQRLSYMDKKHRDKKHNIKKQGSKKKRVFKLLLLLTCTIFAISGMINYKIKSEGEKHLKVSITSAQEKLTPQELNTLADLDADCIMVLGAGLRRDGTPNYMLADRLDASIALYKADIAPKLLFTGDHGQMEYDEVSAMKQYALDRDIPPEDIFLDHAGFSTYESMYRAKEIFEVQTVIVVTQTYHQYRALYIGQKLGLYAYGVSADQAVYGGQSKRELREYIARNKDFFYVAFGASPKYLGEVISINGSGLSTQT